MNTNETRRRSKWAPGGLQQKIVYTTICVAGVIILFNLQFSILGVWLIYKNPAPTMDGVLTQIQSMLWSQCLVATVAAIPLSLWVGLSFFKVCGPIYRFKKYFEEFQAGRWDAPCIIRKGDLLQDLNNEINASLALVTAKIRRQDAILEEAVALLGKEAGSEPLKSLLDRAKSEIAESSERLGDETSKEDAAERDAVGVAGSA